MILLWTLFACAPKPGGDVVWAVNYATVTPDGSGLTGVHVWAFFSEGWDKKRDSEYHVCSLLQRLEGSEVDPYAGCDGCTAMYELDLTDIEHDCDLSVVADPAFEGVAAFGVGAIPSELSGEEPYTDAMGWYLSYDGENAISQGYAYDEDLDYDRPTESEGWEDDQVYTLWPAYAWDLSE